MVRLYEYQGKNLLKNIGVPIPQGEVVSRPKEAKDVAERLKKPVALKSQVWAGRRGKAGGIRFAETPEDAEKLSSEMLGKELHGLKVERLLVEEKLDIEKEYYVGVVVDSSRDVEAPVLMFTTEGGVDIEEIPEEKIQKMTVDVIRGVRVYDAYNLARRAGVQSKFLASIARCIKGVYETFINYDCRVAEVNPLVQTKDGEFYAADCRISIDDSSIYKHPELGIDFGREFPKPPTELEKIAWKVEEDDYRGVFYFAQMAPDRKGPGYVGYHGIGGGGTILGVDALNKQGLKIANYTDTSGNPTASKVYRAAKIVLSQPDIEGYILAGFVVANQEQWHHAHGLVKALREELPKRPGFPVVILLCGNKEKESLEILRKGLQDLPARIEIYGREHVYDTDFIARKMRELVDEYRKEKGIKGAA